MMADLTVDLAVVGAGPGGYAAAFLAADRGQSVVLIEQDARLGGVCLNRGCIPSKALLHATELMRETKGSGELRGIRFGAPSVELARLRAWKESILERLGQGIQRLAERRGVQRLQGRAAFEDSHTLLVASAQGSQRVRATRTILAVGSKPALPALFDVGSDRVLTSTEALELPEVPKRLLIVGGGYIGMELGTVYATLGSHVVLVEALQTILAGVDTDLMRPILRSAQALFGELRTGTRVTALRVAGNTVWATCEGATGVREESYDRVLVCVGRVPYCDGLGLEQTKVRRSAQGFLEVDAARRTADPAIWAIGDCIGPPLLAHKASHDARLAVESIVGGSSTARPAVIPSVVFTDPELAWCGLTEAEARAQGVPVEIVRFPWSASGRAMSLDRTDGLTKLLIEPTTERVLGVGIVGVSAGELIGEGVLAIEAGATAKTLARAVHPHPTLSETLQEAAALFYGTSAHVLGRRSGARS